MKSHGFHGNEKENDLTDQWYVGLVTGTDELYGETNAPDNTVRMDLFFFLARRRASSTGQGVFVGIKLHGYGSNSFTETSIFYGRFSYINLYF